MHSQSRSLVIGVGVILAAAFLAVLVLAHPDPEQLAKAEYPARPIKPLAHPLDTAVTKGGLDTGMASAVMHPAPQCPAPDRGFEPLYVKAAHRHAQGAPQKFGCLVHSIAERESRQRPDAVSPRGALGMLQFLPPTAAELGIDPLNPDEAVEGAARYLVWLSARFPYVKAEDLLKFEIASYNWGVGNVRRTGCHSYACLDPFLPSETRKYVAGVLLMVKTGKWG